MFGAIEITRPNIIFCEKLDWRVEIISYSFNEYYRLVNLHYLLPPSLL